MLEYYYTLYSLDNDYPVHMLLLTILTDYTYYTHTQNTHTHTHTPHTHTHSVYCYLDHASEFVFSVYKQNYTKNACQPVSMNDILTKNRCVHVKIML